MRVLVVPPDLANCLAYHLSVLHDNLLLLARQGWFVLQRVTVLAYLGLVSAALHVGMGGPMITAAVSASQRIGLGEPGDGRTVEALSQLVQLGLTVPDGSESVCSKKRISSNKGAYLGQA